MATAIEMNRGVIKRTSPPIRPCSTAKRMHEMTVDPTGSSYRNFYRVTVFEFRIAEAATVPIEVGRVFAYFTRLPYSDAGQ